MGGHSEKDWEEAGLIFIFVLETLRCISCDIALVGSLQRERMRPIPSRPEIRVSRGPICPPRSVLRSSCRAEPPLQNEGRILLPLRFLSFDLAGLFFHLRDTEYISALYHSDSSPEYVPRLDVGREADRDDGDRGGRGRGGQFVSRFESSHQIVVMQC